jgi:ribosome modulation factor
LQLSIRCIVDLTRMATFIATWATVLTFGIATPTTAGIDGQLAAVSVEPASRDLVVYPLPSTLSQFLPTWREALEDALTRARIFSPTASRRLSLRVKVLEFSLSGKILTAFARYQLFDNPPAAPIFETDIMSNQGISSLAIGVTSLEDPAVATEHRSEVIRAIQDNITQFVDQLEAFAGGHPQSERPRP